MTDVTLSVPEIHCGHCKSSIEGAVRPLDGVASAEVDVETRSVRVVFDAPATLAQIHAVIEDQGYAIGG